MAFDAKKLRLGEQIAGAAAILLFIDLFLSWYSVNVGSALQALANAHGVSTSVSAWTAFDITDIILLIVIVVTLGAVVLAATQRAPALPVAASVIVTVLCAFATLLILWRIINQPGPNDVVNVEFGAYLGLILAAVMTYGGFLMMREEGTTFSDARARAGSMVSQQRTGTTPPPAAGQPAAPPPTTQQPPPASTPPAGTPPAGGSTPPPSTSTPPPPPAQDDPAPPGGTGV